MENTVKGVTGPQGQMLTLREAAAALRMSHYTLRDPAWLARLSAVKVGSKWLVPEGKINALLTGGNQ